MNFPRLQKFITRLDKYFYQLVFVGSFIYVFTIITNYDLTWTFPEVVFHQIPQVVIKTGLKIVPFDLLRGFDINRFELHDPGRSRFVSYFFQTFNIKIRLLLLQFIPPHPSFSFTWIFTLILSPLLFFKLVHELSGDRNAAWAGTSLFLLSTGTLSGITMLFHPAKPLALFFILAGCYLAARLGRYAQREEYFSTRYILLLSVLMGTLLVICFTDETAWYTFICIPILAPGIFRDKRRGLLTIGLCFEMFLVFLFFLTYLAPNITKQLFSNPYFNFWETALGGHFQRLSKYWFVNVFSNAWNVMINQLVPGRIYSWHILPARILYFCVLFIYLVCVFGRLDFDKKKFVLRGLVALLFFFFFQELIMSTVQMYIHTSFYYGNLTSIFLSLPLAVLLTAVKEPFKRLNKIVLIVILFTYAYNFNLINEHWMRIYERDHLEEYPEEVIKMVGNSLSYSMVKQAWDNRSDPIALEMMKPRFPLKALWLFRELDYAGRQPQ